MSLSNFSKIYGVNLSSLWQLYDDVGFREDKEGVEKNYEDYVKVGKDGDSNVSNNN